MHFAKLPTFAPNPSIFIHLLLTCLPIRCFSWSSSEYVLFLSLTDAVGPFRPRSYSAGIEPADFAECSHSKTMPAGIEPAGLFQKTCHEQMYAIKKNTCNVTFHIGSWPVPIRLHVESRDPSTCWSNTCWSYSSLLDC